MHGQQKSYILVVVVIVIVIAASAAAGEFFCLTLEGLIIFLTVTIKFFLVCSYKNKPVQ